MKKTIAGVLGAGLLGVIASTAGAQAMPMQPQVSTPSASASVEHVQYWHHDYYRHRDWHRHHSGLSIHIR